ncbi:MAG: FliH/SctL family protein, partial [Planctomycetota bacterium]
IIESARAQADSIICEAEERMESIRSSAHEEGYRIGHKEGLAEGRRDGNERAMAEATRKFDEQQAGLIESCKRLIAGIEADRDAWFTSARQDLIDLAMAIARRVVVHVGGHEREVILANLEEAIELTGARSQVTVMVNPADAESAKIFAQSLVDAQQQWKHVRVVEEGEILPGGCRIQWESGAVDATLETQLDRIAAELNSAKDVVNGNMRDNE